MFLSPDFLCTLAAVLAALPVSKKSCTHPHDLQEEWVDISPLVDIVKRLQVSFHELDVFLVPRVILKVYANDNIKRRSGSGYYYLGMRFCFGARPRNVFATKSLDCRVFLHLPLFFALEPPHECEGGVFGEGDGERSWL